MQFYVEEIPVEDDGTKTPNVSNLKDMLAPNSYTIKTLTAKKDNSPAGRGGCTITRVENKLYIIGGANREATHFDDVNIFDIGRENNKITWNYFII